MDRFTAARGLARLPRELMDMVIGNLEHDQTSLSRLSRTCRLFQDIIPPHLYSWVVLRENKCEGFAAAIDRVPKRAEYVKNLAIHCHYLIKDDKDWNARLAQTLPPTLGRLMRLPNLKSLAVIGASVGDSDFQQCFTDKHRRASNSLEEILLLSCDLSPAALGEIVSLPKALRRLTITGGVPGVQYYDGQRPRHMKTNHQLYIDQIEQKAASLIELEFDICLIHPESNSPVDLQRLSAVETLQMRASALQGNNGRGRPGSGGGMLHNLAENLLPRSLKDLTVWELSWRSFQQLQLTYVSTLGGWFKKGQLPALESVTLVGGLVYNWALMKNPEREFNGEVEVHSASWDAKLSECPLGCGCGAYRRHLQFWDQ
ncbi:hypothetical protein BJX99DRAFT_225865 [Aspergillus californicus]